MTGQFQSSKRIDFKRQSLLWQIICWEYPQQFPCFAWVELAYMYCIELCVCISLLIILFKRSGHWVCHSNVNMRAITHYFLDAQPILAVCLVVMCRCASFNLKHLNKWRSIGCFWWPQYNFNLSFMGIVHFKLSYTSLTTSISFAVKFVLEQV